MNLKDRKKTRFIANFDGFYRLRNQIDWQDCHIYDISETGTLIRIKQSLIVDDWIEICLDIENKTDVIIGKVANVQGQVAGIKFDTKNVHEIVDRAIDRAFSQARSSKKRFGF